MNLNIGLSPFTFQIILAFEGPFRNNYDNIFEDWKCVCLFITLLFWIKVEYFCVLPGTLSQVAKWNLGIIPSRPSADFTWCYEALLGTWITWFYDIMIILCGMIGYKDLQILPLMHSKIIWLFFKVKQIILHAYACLQVSWNSNNLNIFEKLTQTLLCTSCV